MDSKRLLVISDSHGNVRALKTVFTWAKEQMPPKGSICACACLGDGLSDLEKAADAAGFYCDWKLVRGNNDFGFQLPEAAVFDFADHRFFMCHGHKQSIYSGYHILQAAAKNNDADAALFGHSHVPFLKISDGITLINPGSVSHPRSETGATFAVIECPLGEPLIIEFFGISEKQTIQKIMINKK